MENTREQILNEINEMIADIRERVAAVEAKVAQLENIDAEPVAIDTTPVEIDAAPIEMEAVDVWPEDIIYEDPETVIAEPATETEPVFEPEPISITEPEPVFEPEPAPVIEPEPVFEPEPQMNIFGQEEPSDAGTLNAKHRSRKKSIGDAKVEGEAWRIDIPGSPVKDVRSAISLNDRIIFIRDLFKGDPMAFQGTMAAINGMDSFVSALQYLQKIYPDWKYDSDTVYRFMMAVRRKLK